MPFDVIGLSYYPFFHGSISAMRQNVDALATQFHKPIVIAETQYPWTLANGNSPIGDSTGNFVWEPSQLSPGYPASPGGHAGGVRVLAGRQLAGLGAQHGQGIGQLQPLPHGQLSLGPLLGGTLRGALLRVFPERAQLGHPGQQISAY